MKNSSLATLAAAVALLVAVPSRADVVGSDATPTQAVEGYYKALHTAEDVNAKGTHSEMWSDVRDYLADTNQSADAAKAHANESYWLLPPMSRNMPGMAKLTSISGGYTYTVAKESAASSDGTVVVTVSVKNGDKTLPDTKLTLRKTDAGQSTRHKGNHWRIVS